MSALPPKADIKTLRFACPLSARFCCKSPRSKSNANFQFIHGSLFWRKANYFMATKTEYLLSELRCASLRARLLQSDVDAIGLALKAGLISADQAVGHLADCGLLRLLGLREEEAAA
jgi:hypothetical protein